MALLTAPRYWGTRKLSNLFMAMVLFLENGLGGDGGRDSEVNCLCCGGRCLVPRSIVSKLSSRGGIYKFFGDFGLRENIYYGSIFVCMTLIVIVCFLVINNRNGWGSSGLAGSTTAAFYDFGEWLTSTIFVVGYHKH